jgi:DNA-binding NarL/FixJ family response regulator
MCPDGPWAMLHRMDGERRALRVAIVEDSREIRHRLTHMLEASAHIEVVGCADDVAGAVALLDTQRPDVVVLDVRLRHGERGYNVLRHAVRQHPATRVVVLSNFDWPEMRHGFLQGGACAYFDKALQFDEARRWVVGQAETLNA